MILRFASSFFSRIFLAFLQFWFCTIFRAVFQYFFFSICFNYSIFLHNFSSFLPLQNCFKIFSSDLSLQPLDCLSYPDICRIKRSLSRFQMSEMVNLHFINLLEALKETRCTILMKLLPIWSPVLSSHSSLSTTLQQRLKAIRDSEPDLDNPELHQSEALLKFLQKLQFKMGQIEVQSSTATQFYSI